MKPIREVLRERILILDGAMGTSLQAMNLTAEDFGGKEFEGCNEYLVITKPDAIRAVHRSYLAAGADIIETNTFGGMPFVLGEFDLSEKAYDINFTAARLARECADEFSTEEKPRYVAGSMGPTTKSLSVTGGISFDEMAESYYQLTVPLIKGGSDFLLLETALDTLNLKAGYCGILKAFEELGVELPIAISGTIETMGTMLAGQGVEALYTSVEHMDLLYIGLNCATGPEFMRDHIRTLSEMSRFPVAVAPNAGIPDPDGTYPETPEMLAGILETFINDRWVNIVGGCCGTTPAHIQKLAEVAAGKKPLSPTTEVLSRLSGTEALILEEDNRPYIVGERSNVIGSRAFKTLIQDEKWDEACEVARKQVKAGGQIVDICLSNPDRDEIQDTILFYDKITRMIKAPIMVDSQVPEVVEEAFKRTQGKCILNSVNLEDGEKSFEELIPLVKKYGAAVVVGCIQGEMAVTAQAKLDVAIESHRLLTTKYGLHEEDLIFDPLVFPCGTGDEAYFGSGKETIEGVRLIKKHFPRCRTTLGISNVSFGLPGAGREVLNSVFLYHCTKAGLDTAIVNSEKLVRYAQITDEEKKLCDDLLWYRTENGNDPIGNFAAYFRDKKVETVVIDRSALNIDEKLEINIVQGTKEYLIENLDEALQQWDSLGVINGPLMRAMAIVGRMFNENELIVAEVLQSAEVMKTAVAHLEQFMEKAETSTRATMLLATVKGDVHDIGKNLVEIILSNNGYKIIDLGIKCPPEVLIEACREHKPDLIGLSGLLVKSAQQMVITAADLKAAGISVPLLVGGAALSENFTTTKIAPAYGGPVIYCRDAMTGLDVCHHLTDENAQAWIATHLAKQKEKREEVSQPKKVRPLEPKPVYIHPHTEAKVPHFEPVIVTETLETIWPYMNPQMMYGTHLGLKGNIKKLLADGDEKAVKLSKLLSDLKEKIIRENLVAAKGLYQFFKVRAEGESLIILDDKTELEKMRFTFPRQEGGKQLCLTDFIDPDRIDTVCFFVVTCGDGVADAAKKLLQAGNYFESHGLSAIALEAAEGFSEFIHQRIRKEWGIGDPETVTQDDLFKLRYTGKRLSFGYPACPNLDDQGKLWELMRPDEKIGVDLSEEFMMYPEASVSALVFHHPQAVYFSVDGEGVIRE